MKTIKINNRTLLFVEVPDEAIAELMHVDNTGLFTCLDCMVIFSGNPPEPDHEEWRTLLEVQLPTGNYRLITTTDTITEKQAAMFVDNWDGSHKDTTFTISPLIEMVQNLSIELGESITLLKFKSLLQHHSITGRHAIIEVL